MDMRDYDPAIGRWTGIDPVTHFSQSPYCAMNGNPVFWADPSGADGFHGDGNGGTVYTNAYGVANYQGFNGYNSIMSNFGAYEGGFGSVADEMGTGNYSTSNPGEMLSILNYYGLTSTSKIWVAGNFVDTNDGNPRKNILDSVIVNGHWEYANSFNNFVGYAAFAGEAVNHSWAGATFKYGQRINGVVYSAEALTEANRVSSLLWASRFAKVNFVSGLIGTGVSYYHIYDSASAGRQINNWDVADASVGTIAAASSGTSLAIAAGLLNPASLGAAAFLVSNPVGWGIAIGTTAYFTYRLISEYNKN